MSIYSIAFSLFLLMDGIGNVPIFISLLKDTPPERQRKIIFRELVIALGIMILFFFLGDALLMALNVTGSTVMIAGGLILFLIALKMIFPVPKDPDIEMRKDKEPFIVPLAIPLVAGPGILASIMLYSRQEISPLIVIAAIVLAWVPTALILISGTWIEKILGWRFMVACERLMGLILTLIAIQMFLQGLTTCFVHTG